MDKIPNWVYGLVGKALKDFMNEDRCEELRASIVGKLEEAVAKTEIPLDDDGLVVVKRLLAYKS